MSAHRHPMCVVFDPNRTHHRERSSRAPSHIPRLLWGGGCLRVHSTNRVLVAIDLRKKGFDSCVPSWKWPCPGPSQEAPWIQGSPIPCGRVDFRKTMLMERIARIYFRSVDGDPLAAICGRSC